MNTQLFRLFFFLCCFWAIGLSFAQAQDETTAPTPTSGSNFPNRFTGRQIVLTLGSDPDRPEYRLLDSGLLYFRTGTEGPFKQYGQQPKQKVQQIFAVLEQDLKIKTTKLDTVQRPDVTLTWKRARTEFPVSWANRNAPPIYEQFRQDFLLLFPKPIQKR